MKRSICDRAVLFLMCIPVLQTVFVPEMPGLNSDVAQWGISAYQMLHNRSLIVTGVTPYGGVVRIYLIATATLLLGMSRLALELPFALTNSLTILFTYLLVKRIFSERAGVICVIVLSCSPWFALRDPDCWYYLIIALSLYCISSERTRGAVLG